MICGGLSGPTRRRLLKAGIIAAPAIILPRKARSAANATINITYDASWTGGQTAGVLTPALTAAVAYLESLIHLPITFQIGAHYTVIGGSASTSSRSYFNSSLNYAATIAAYKNNITTANAQTAWNNFPAISPWGGLWQLPRTLGRALGNIANSDTNSDGFITLNSSDTFFYGTPVGGAYDAFGLCLHELTEVMGRGCTVTDGSGNASVGDLFRLSGVGGYYTGGSFNTYGGSFSIDGGNTLGRLFNPTGGGDLGDWKTVDNDCCNASGSTGTTLFFSAIDQEFMDVLGYSAGGGPMFSSFMAHQ